MAEWKGKRELLQKPRERRLRNDGAHEERGIFYRTNNLTSQRAPPKEHTPLTFPPFPDMTVLKYIEPAPMGSTEEPKAVTTTVHSYDSQQLRGLFKSQLMGIGMMGVMHLYFAYTNPLLIQSIIPLKGAFEGNLVKVHLLGYPAKGDLERPWKAAAGGMMGMMGGANPGGAAEIKTDKRSVEKAERAGRGGAKEE